MDVAAPVNLRSAVREDRPSIYRLRHEVFAAELGQHPTNPSRELFDELDDVNEYLVAERESRLLGFISVTPPTAGKYSFQKYFPAGTRFPFAIDDRLFEVRLLTIDREARIEGLVYFLFHAAYRWCEQRGADRLVALGHDRVLPLYRSVGMEIHPEAVRSGALQFHLVSAEVAQMRPRVEAQVRHLRPLMSAIPYHWNLDVPFVAPDDAGASELG